MCPKCQAFFQDESLYIEHLACCDGTGWPKEPLAEEKQPQVEDAEPEVEPPVDTEPEGEANVEPEPEDDTTLVDECQPEEKPKNKAKK